MSGRMNRHLLSLTKEEEEEEVRSNLSLQKIPLSLFHTHTHTHTHAHTHSHSPLSHTAPQTSFLTLGQVKELDLGHGDKPDYFSCKASKSNNCLYKACPKFECNKKVTEGTAGEYWYEKCSQGFLNFKYRLIVAVSV